MESGKLAIFAHSSADRVAGQKLLRLKGLAGKLTFQSLQLGKVFIPVLMGLWYNAKLPQNCLRPKSAE
jgi:hypothetical protein